MNTNFSITTKSSQPQATSVIRRMQRMLLLIMLIMFCSILFSANAHASAYASNSPNTVWYDDVHNPRAEYTQSYHSFDSSRRYYSYNTYRNPIGYEKYTNTDNTKYTREQYCKTSLCYAYHPIIITNYGASNGYPSTTARRQFYSYTTNRYSRGSRIATGYTGGSTRYTGSRYGSYSSSVGNWDDVLYKSGDVGYNRYY